MECFLSAETRLWTKQSRWRFSLAAWIIFAGLVCVGFAAQKVSADKDNPECPERRMLCPMGDNSPKNQHKLDEQKHEEDVKKDHTKLENAEHQHHPDRDSTPDEVLALKKQEEETDATSARAAE